MKTRDKDIIIVKVSEVKFLEEDIWRPESALVQDFIQLYLRTAA